MRTRLHPCIAFAGVAALVACGKNADANPRPEELAAFVGKPAVNAPGLPSRSAERVTSTRSVDDTSTIDPCTFFTHQEVESAVGHALQPGSKRRTEPVCRYLNPTRGSVVVRVGEPVSKDDFEYMRKEVAGAEAEGVPGIGDDAYLWGSRLYVRSGGRELVLTLASNGSKPQIRAALLALGKLGAQRLR